MKKTILLLFLLVLNNTFLKAQSSWINYNTTNGLFSNSALEITCDKFNNVWVGVGLGSMGYGLDKFDGTSWTHFDSSNSGLPENDIRVLKADTNGNLWMSYFGGIGPNITGLTKFDGTNWIIYDTTNSNVLSNLIGDIQIDKQNNVWLSCPNGLSKFDGTNFTNYPHAGAGKLIVTDSANIWLGNYGLDHFNPITGIWTHYDQGNSNIPSNYVSCIAQDADGIIWLGFSFGFNGGLGTGGTNGGLATFNGTTFTTIWPMQSFYTGVYDLTIDAKNNVWVATRCEGLYKFDGVSWINIAGVPLSGCSYSVAADHQNNIWFAEVSSGVWTNNSNIVINEHFNSNNVNIYPNPAADYFIIPSAIKNNDYVIITNSIGQEILNIESTSDSDKLVVDTRNFSTGIYYWRQFSNNQCFYSGKVAIIK